MSLSEKSSIFQVLFIMLSKENMTSATNIELKNTWNIHKQKYHWFGRDVEWYADIIHRDNSTDIRISVLNDSTGRANYRERERKKNYSLIGYHSMRYGTFHTNYPNLGYDSFNQSLIRSYYEQMKYILSMENKNKTQPTIIVMFLLSFFAFSNSPTFSVSQVNWLALLAMLSYKYIHIIIYLILSMLPMSLQRRIKYPKDLQHQQFLIYNSLHSFILPNAPKTWAWPPWNDIIT